IERIKELSLIGGLASHHRRNPLANREKNGITPPRLGQRGNEFFNSIDPIRSFVEVARLINRRL
ncbi:hypothetical protein, partial [Rhodoblastus sp.]|uniref:hypothetical protein n=1 Tax=Rhodoblastus sp. TaxID=1962975 RepID=UPI0025CC8B39